MSPSFVAQVDGQVVALLVQNLERLDESVKEEADGVHNTLGKEDLTDNLSSWTQSARMQMCVTVL